MRKLASTTSREAQRWRPLLLPAPQRTLAFRARHAAAGPHRRQNCCPAAPGRHGALHQLRSLQAVAGAATASGASAPAGDESLPAALAAQWPGGEFSVQMQVRDYELDQFGVVNNAVYSSYLQHGRHEALCALGADADAYARRGTPLALASLAIAFRAPLRSRDVFRVTVATAKVTPARLVLQQRILRSRAGAAAAGAAGTADAAAADAGEELIAEAEAVVVFLDSAYKPTRLPKDVARLFQALQRMRQTDTDTRG